MRDNRLKREYITNHHFANLFRLLLPTGEWDGSYADSRDQQDILVTEVDQRTIRFHYPRLPRQAKLRGLVRWPSFSVRRLSGLFPESSESLQYFGEPSALSGSLGL